MGIFGVATVVMVILKFAGVISWSWWLVFSPVILSVVLNILIEGLSVSISHKVTKSVVNEHEERPYWSNRGDK
ncbi:hypothetical protein [Weissella cibaria]|uniref:hypothetical protein n=1 Tax=Weissella cibaria TaxID=137591 RepID=UPI0013DC818B|nr:hypothetical protein [Weissella cibaria]NFA02010.1 hypothetical protein [Weissella cibaria]